MAAILECSACGTCYESPTALPPQGRKVRCAKCGSVWLAKPDDRPAAAAEPDEEDIAFRDDDGEAQAPEEDSGDGAGDADLTGGEPAPGAAAEAEGAEGDDAGAGADIPGDDDDRQASADDDAPLSAAEAVPPPRRPAADYGADRRRRAVAIGWLVLALVLAGGLVLAYDKRVAIVRALPGAAAAFEWLGLPVNVRGLSFDKVAYAWTVEAGRPILEIEGEIRNLTDTALPVPTVVFALRNKDDVEVYQWAADVLDRPLPAGERTAFVARIPSPPKSIEKVQVRFARPR